MVNKVILVGNAGADPEVRTVGEGDRPAKVARLRMATTKSFKKSDGERASETTWHTVTFWRGLADVVGTYVKKGQMLYVEGEIKNGSYEKDGVTVYTTEIVASDMKMLGSKPAGESGKEEAQEGGTDDLPF